MKQEERIIKIIEELNSNLPTWFHENGSGFDYHTNGYIDLVNFCDFAIYNSECNSTDEIEEAGGLKEFIMQEAYKYINELSKLDNILKESHPNPSQQDAVQKNIIPSKYLKEDLVLEECVKILNELAEHIGEWDGGSDGLYYIAVGNEAIPSLEKLVKNTEKYLEEAREEICDKDECFDIVPLWADVCTHFAAEVCFQGNTKKIFSIKEK